MKKIGNAISWVSFITIIAAMGLSSLFAGIAVASYLTFDVLQVEARTWYAPLMSLPVIIVTGYVVMQFLVLGMKNFSTDNL